MFEQFTVFGLMFKAAEYLESNFVDKHLQYVNM